LKFIHLSDLHLGIRVSEFSMMEDQKYILDQILAVTDREKPDGVIIAGDIYDKSVPPAEAVQMFDDFLYALSMKETKVFVISGNHDSSERIAFGSRLMDRSGIYLSPVYDGKVEPVSLEDGYGTVKVFMLPFIKPSAVGRFFPEEKISSYTDAVRCAVSRMNIDPRERNVIVTHQFVTGAFRSESEDISVGGTDNVDAAVFSSFDYAALGHIHGPQNISPEEGSTCRIRYCGTPLKYSFSEAGQNKSVTVVEMKEKGNLAVTSVALTPLRDMREIRGEYLQLMSRTFYQGTSTEDYLHVTLTDEDDVPDGLSKLRVVYPNIMKLDYDNMRTRSGGGPGRAENAESRSPMELFSEFYEKQNNQPMKEEQKQLSEKLIREIWEENE